MRRKEQIAKKTQFPKKHVSTQKDKIGTQDHSIHKVPSYDKKTNATRAIKEKHGHNIKMPGFQSFRKRPTAYFENLPDIAEGQWKALQGIETMLGEIRNDHNTAHESTGLKLTAIYEQTINMNQKMDELIAAVQSLGEKTL